MLRNVHIEEPPPTRARMAEARRNRETLLEVAARVFRSGASSASLATIAHEAGVGIGTLYRHFPTREALVEAVYRDQIDRLGEGARELLAGHPPTVAFRLWMDLFRDWAATKHGMIDTLRSTTNGAPRGAGEMRARLTELVRMFVDSGQRAGDVRSDVEPADVSALLAGVLSTSGAPGQKDQAGRMFDVIINGLRA